MNSFTGTFGMAMSWQSTSGGRRNGGWQNGGWKVFWIYWDVAWSLIISGITFITIVSQPDAELVEIQAASRMN